MLRFSEGRPARICSSASGVARNSSWGDTLEAKTVSGRRVLGEGAASPLPTSYRVWGSRVSSPNRVRAEPRPQMHFGLTKSTETRLVTASVV